VAIHFHLKKKIEDSFTVPDCLELEGFDGRLISEVRAAYLFLILTKCAAPLGVQETGHVVYGSLWGSRSSPIRSFAALRNPCSQPRHP
jgi:hypothetical protein